MCRRTSSNSADSFFASRRNLQNAQEATDFKYFPHLWLHTEEYQLPSLSFQAFSDHKHDAQARTGDVLEAAEIQQESMVASVDQTRYFVFNTGGIAAIKLTCNADESCVL